MLLKAIVTGTMRMSIGIGWIKLRIWLAIEQRISKIIVDWIRLNTPLWPQEAPHVILAGHVSIGPLSGAVALREPS
jgi:hypothetical protein